MERRNFFKRALAFLGIAGVAESAPLLRKGDRLSINFTGEIPVDANRAAKAERLEVTLAGVSTAAAGWLENPAKPGDWAWHPAYQDTLDLRRKFEAAIKIIAASSAVTRAIVLYPCGCSSSGHAPILDSAGLPLYCPEHGDHEHAAGTTVIQGSLPLGRALAYRRDGKSGPRLNLPA